MTFEEVWNQVSNFTQMNVGEASLLFSYSEKVPNKAILVELGTWKGGSACVMGAATKNMVFTIDNFRTDTYPSRRENEPGRGDSQETENNLKEIENVTLLIGNNEDFAKSWKRKIHLLFVDSDHRYDSVKTDVTNWLPHVVKGGIVLFHDYQSHEGVGPAVDEFIKDKKLKKIEQILTLLVTKKI